MQFNIPVPGKKYRLTEDLRYALYPFSMPYISPYDIDNADTAAIKNLFDALGSSTLYGKVTKKGFEYHQVFQHGFKSDATMDKSTTLLDCFIVTDEENSPLLDAYRDMKPEELYAKGPASMTYFVSCTYVNSENNKDFVVLTDVDKRYRDSYEKINDSRVVDSASVDQIVSAYTAKVENRRSGYHKLYEDAVTSGADFSAAIGRNVPLQHVLPAGTAFKFDGFIKKVRGNKHIKTKLPLADITVHGRTLTLLVSDLCEAVWQAE